MGILNEMKVKNAMMGTTFLEMDAHRSAKLRKGLSVFESRMTQTTVKLLLLLL